MTFSATTKVYSIYILISQIDSAAAYHNEQACGDAIRASGIPRDKIFITTKVPHKSQGYEKAKKSIADSLRLSGLDYFDL